MVTRRIPRPAVFRTLRLDRHGVIEASAGTGKTFTIERLVVELLVATDATLDRLLVVTFTEKATHELRARVRAQLEGVLAGLFEADADVSAKDGDVWELDAAALAKIERALRSFDSATIATIHAFCQRVLREHAFEGGRLFQEEQVDGRAAFGRAMRDALRRDVATDPARAHWLEAALRAGRSMESLEDLLWRCVQARADVRPEFDVAALDTALAAFPVEAARRGGAAAELKSLGVHKATAEKLARKIAEMAERVEEARSNGGAPRFAREATGLELGWLLEKLWPIANRSGAAGQACAAAFDLARRTPPFNAAVVQALLPSVQDELARTKRAAGRYDFDDMLTLVDEALRGPRGGALAEAMRARWKYALVDEFQDTDETQWSIFRRAFFAPGSASRLFLVGDPKQSIYRFRGADIETYLRARAEVLDTGGVRVSLTQNYRATAPLVAAINAIFAPDVAEPFFSGDVSYEPIECGRPDRRLVDGAGRAVDPVQAIRFDGELDLTALGAVVAREVRCITHPERPWRLDGRALRASDVFVLTRTGWEGRAVGAALAAAGVPYAYYKEEGLFQSAEAKDLRALLSAICDPDDRSLRLAAWLTPFFGLPLETIEQARDLPASHPLMERLYGWKALADARDFDRLFESILSASGVVRREIFFGRGERSLTNTTHVLEMLLDRARGPHLTLRELVRELSGLIARTRLPLDVEGNVQRVESDRPAVQIMTIHKAKGLEAAVVFVACSWGSRRPEEVRIFHEGARRFAWVGSVSGDLKPHVEREEREEDQRLMYVALTRAAGRLYLPYAEASARAKPVRGPYAPVHRRLAALLSSATPGFGVDDVGERVRDAPPPEAAPVAWEPVDALLGVDDVRASYDALRAGHAGPIVTSYTRLKGTRSASDERWAEPTEGRRAAKAAEFAEGARGATLKAARASGVFLHELLESVPLASFAGAGLDAWRRRADVAPLFDEAMGAHRIDAAQREDAERLVWTAYTTPVTLPDGHRIEGFALPGGVVREMDFAYPLPDLDHPSLVEGWRQAPARVGPGYVRGSLDLAFEHLGRTYFVDWKSDLLAEYEPEALGRHVMAHYDDQVRLYALAVIRLVGIRSADDYDERFGGLAYCFLRGFGPSGRGLWAARPVWSDILAWDERFRRRRQWGVARR